MYTYTHVYIYLYLFIYSLYIHIHTYICIHTYSLHLIKAFFYALAAVVAPHLMSQDRLEERGIDDSFQGHYKGRRV